MRYLKKRNSDMQMSTQFRISQKKVLAGILVLGILLCGCSITEPAVKQKESDVLQSLQQQIPKEEDAVQNQAVTEPDVNSDNSDEIGGLSEADEGFDVSTDSEKEDSSESDLEDSLAEEDLFPADADGIVRITISGAGDVTLGTTQQQDYSYSFDQMYDTCGDISYFFANVSDYFATDDCTIVNLEGPLTNADIMREEREFIIKGKPEYVHILSAGNIDLVGFSNNHQMDYNQEGANETMALLENESIPYAANEKYGIFETAKGIKVGLIAVHTSCLSDYANKLIKNGISSLREQGADLVVVNVHWGIERNNYPEDYQQTMGRNCIDWGADLVLGSHPHVLQGIEVYKGKCIVYSLANFCFGGNRNPVDKDTMIFRQTFEFKEGELLDTLKVQVIPSSVSSDSSRNNYQPTPAEGDEFTRILNRIREYSVGFGTEFDEDGSLLVG